MKRHSLICRFRAGETQSVPVVETDSTVTEVPFVSGERAFDYGLGQLLDHLAKLGLQPSEAAFDLALLSALVFCADTRISRGRDGQDSWTREIDLYLPVSDVELWEANRQTLVTALHFLTGDEWRVFFRPRPEHFETIVPVPEQGEFPRFSCASLFSGGLDSYIGAVDLLAKGETPIFVSHYADGNTSPHQKKCLANLKEAYRDSAFGSLLNYVSFGKDVIRDNPGESTQRGRSFLFFGLGLLAASGLEGDVTLHVPENGFIALNVPLDPLRLGSLSTRTTHPFYMARMNDLAAGLRLNVRLYNHYRKQTKGQMVAGCQNKALLVQTAKDTMSCSSPAKARWKRLPQGHCGYCVPCLIRRASLIKGLGSDDTPHYTVPDLGAHVFSAHKVDGQHVRSFQLALANLEADPGSADFAIHSPGPLSDVREEWADLAKVYADGLHEVGAILQGVEVRP
ncbi:MAG: hypothetical protein INR62_04640 [Rhodospirillales bacterium]|nr:hypothetical protein [Acetobacter sp.]